MIEARSKEETNMSQLVHALSTETQNFLRDWRDKSLTLVDPFNNEVLASDLFESYMPACDGTITLFKKGGDKECIKVTNGIVRRKREEGWPAWFFIKK